MCGIFAALDSTDDIDATLCFQETCTKCPLLNSLESNKWEEKTVDFLRRRGPDAWHKVVCPLENHQAFTLEAAVLSLRGNKVTAQPFADSLGNLLLFNGEIYSGDDCLQPENQENDTFLVANLLGDMVERYEKKLVKKPHVKELCGVILDCLDKLEGPWSIIYYIARFQCLIFGRDILGRRSLLMGKRDPHSLFISSVTPQDTVCENCLIELAPMGMFYLEYVDKVQQWRIGCCEREKQPMGTPSPPGAPRNPLFLASFLPKNMYRVEDGTNSSLSRSFVDNSVEQTFLEMLRNAVFQRVDKLQVPYNENSTSNLPFSLLFSGGIDSLVLAKLLWHACQTRKDYCNIPIDLINVCFGPPFSGPDRTTAIRGVKELNRLCFKDSDHVSFRLLLVDVDIEAYKQHRKHLNSLLMPCNTPMDISIGYTLWFGARAKGYWWESASSYEKANEEVSLNSRVLFSGLGADELLGGYKGRHRRIFQQGGWSSLAKELNMDLSRLWWRNLGRDDRVVSDHGRELRLPFIDERVIKYVISIPLHMVCNLELPDGEGDKLILRQVAKLLGFSDTFVSTKKKAMQFGSKSCLAQAQLPTFSLFDQRYSFKRHLTEPTVPGEIARYWSGTGNTKVTVTQGIQYIQLTGDQPESYGTFYNVLPVQQDHWNLSFAYRIITDSFQPRVDGFAFWYSKFPPNYGPIFGNTVDFNGLGVVTELFDIEANAPSMYPIVNREEPKKWVESERANEKWSRGCLLQSLTGKVILSYNRGVLSVFYWPVQKQVTNPQLCFETVTTPLPVPGYFGFTAKSGKYATRYEILQVSASVEHDKEEMVVTANEKPPIMSSQASTIGSSRVDTERKNSPATSKETTTMNKGSSMNGRQSNPFMKPRTNSLSPQEKQHHNIPIENSDQATPVMTEKDSLHTDISGEQLQSLMEQTNHVHHEILERLDHLTQKWNSSKNTNVFVLLAIALVILLQLYALLFYYRKMSTGLRYNKLL